MTNKYLWSILLVGCLGCAPQLSPPSEKSGDGTEASAASSPSGSSNGAPSSGGVAGNQFLIPPPQALVINEIYYDSTETDSDGNVFVELFGTAGGNLEGYRVRLVNGSDGKKTDEVVFKSGVLVPEDGFFVLADSKTGSSTESRVANADYVENFDPQNGPDSIQLLDPQGDVVDVVGYGEGMAVLDADNHPFYEGHAALSASAGKSLSRIGRLDTQDNLQDFVVNENPSPGSDEVVSDEMDSPGEEKDPESPSLDEDSPAQIARLSEPVDSNPGDPGDAEEVSVTAGEVHFTEVVTDPQRDWNDTAGGDGILFDSIYGSGTVGTTDEWVEIYNGRSAPVDLRAWKLEMLDGTDTSLAFGGSVSLLYFDDGSAVDHFEAGSFLVVGNPPGDMKNTIALRLLNEEGTIVDELNVENADATGAQGESFQTNDSGEWFMGFATPGF